MVAGRPPADKTLGARYRIRMWILLLWIAGCATRPPPPAADPHTPPQEVQEALEPVLQRAATRCGPNDVGKNPEDLLSEEERTLIALHGRWTKPKLRALWDKGYVHAGVMLMKIGERDLGRRAKELWFADDRYYVREDTWRLAWPCRRLLERAATSSSVNGWRMRLTDEEKALVRANPTRPNINALVRAGNSTWMQIWANQDTA